MENSRLMLETVKGKLTAEDDVGLWETALRVLADEFLQKYEREPDKRTWIFLVGACSRWVRPHNSRWNAASGFVYPEGYQSSLPELDWSAMFSYSKESWTPLKKLPGKRTTIFRVAIPSRTARHKQAAVHTKWSTSQVPVFYGFRNLNSSWKCAAASDEHSQSGMVARPEDMTHP